MALDRDLNLYLRDKVSELIEITVETRTEVRGVREELTSLRSFSEIQTQSLWKASSEIKDDMAKQNTRLALLEQKNSKYEKSWWLILDKLITIVGSLIVGAVGAVWWI